MLLPQAPSPQGRPEERRRKGLLFQFVGNTRLSLGFGSRALTAFPPFSVGQNALAGEHMVILEFPGRANAEAFLADPDIQNLFKIRHATTTSRLVLVDGCT
jgi:uncharacterized protein (DUF1330 family)